MTRGQSMDRTASGASGPERRGRLRGPRILQRERKRRGWSQARLCQELRKAAASQGYELPGDASLACMVSRWENGHCEPDILYRSLLCQVYGKTEEELGFTDADRAGGDKAWLSMTDFCRELEVPYSTAYKWSSFGSESGRFPPCRRLPNGKIRIRRQDFNEWLDGLPTL